MLLVVLVAIKLKLILLYFVLKYIHPLSKYLSYPQLRTLAGSFHIYFYIFYSCVYGKDLQLGLVNRVMCRHFSAVK